MKSRLNPLLRTFALSTIFVSPSYAENIVKANNTNALNLTTSWTGGAIPGAPDIAIWNSTVTAANSVALGANTSWSGLQIQSPGGAVSITGTNTLTLGTDGLTHTGTAALTLAPKISLNGAQTWDIAAGTVTASGEVLGSGSLSKTGNGTLFLSTNNTFTGDLTLKAGVLTVSNAGALGTAAGGLIIEGGTIRTEINNTGITLGTAKPITLSGNFSYTYGGTTPSGILDMNSGPVTLTKTVTIDNGAGVMIFRGPISGNFGIVKSGAGTLALLGDNSYSGTTDLRTSANLRTNGTASIATTNVYLNGGLIEIGGPLEEVTKIPLGTGPGQVRFKDNATTIGNSVHGGVSSDAGYRRIEFVSANDPSTPLPLVWGVPSLGIGTPHFISSPNETPAWGGANGIFLMSTPQSSGTIELINDLDLSGTDRRFSIRDGSAKGMPDAVLSGVITNGSISLQGGGCLFINNPNNTLSGNILIVQAVLRVPEIAGYLGTAHVELGGGTLEVGPGTQVEIGTGPGQVSFSADKAGGLSVYGANHSLEIQFNDSENPTNVLRWGASGFIQNDIALALSSSSSINTTIISNPIELGSTSRTFNVANGVSTIDATLKGLISGTGGITLSGSGALLLDHDANNYTGPTVISSGAIVLKTLVNGGIPSSIGASSSDAANLVINGGGIRYIGNGATTDRLFDFRNTATINSSGSGPIVFSNLGDHTFSSAAGSATTRTLSISGISPGLNEIRGAIKDSSTANNFTAVSKSGTSAWSLSGNNTFTGTTNVGGGELILDYSSGNTPASRGTTTIGNSLLTLKGKSVGTTSVSLPTLRLGGGGNSIHNRLTFASNGGDGIHLTVNSLGGNTSTDNALITSTIDISDHPANAITINGIANGLTEINQVLIANASGTPLVGGRSNVILKDSGGYGFAATATSSFPTTLTRLNTSEMLALDAATVGSNVANYRLAYSELPDSGEPGVPRKLLRSENLVFGTLTVDTSAGPIDLDLGTKSFGNNTGSNGRGILVSGEHDFRLTGTGSMSYAPFIYHYGTGIVSTDLQFPNTYSLIAGGTGVYLYNGEINIPDIKIYAAGSHFRLANTGNISALTGGGIWLGDGSILEIASDTNGGATGDFSNSTGNGNGQVRFTGSTGVSAFGANRVIDFGGNAALLTWGGNYFLTSSTNNDTDNALLLSSAKSDATVTIVNPIDLNGRDRIIDVRDGTAATDAILSGSISGIGSGLVKRGLGTLTLDAENSYDGVTEVAAGTLRLTHATLSDEATVRLRSGAKLDLPHGEIDVVAAITVDGVAKAPGIYSATNLPGLITGSGKLQVGNVPASPYDLWSSALPEGKRGPNDDADEDGIVNILEYATGSNGSVPNGSVLSLISGGFSFGRADGRTDLTVILETSPDLAAPWTEVARSTGGASFIKDAAYPTLVISEAPAGGGVNSVNVTGMQLPTDDRRFYRLRVTQP